MLLLVAAVALAVAAPRARADAPPGCPELGSYKEIEGTVDNDGSGTVSPGDDIKYKITVFNWPALTTATDVEFTDAIPAWTTANNDATVEGWPGDGTIVSQDPLKIEGMTVSWGCWSGRTIKFSARIVCPVDCGTIISNQGFFKYGWEQQEFTVPTDDPGTPELLDPTNIPVVSRSKLAVVKSVSPEGTVKPGDQLDYTLTITNSGCMNAKNVVLDDLIPANASAVGNATTTSGVVETQDPLKITGITVNKGTPVTVTFSVKVDKPLDCGTEIKNKASATYDPDGNCQLPPETADSNEVVNPVISAADLAVVKSVSPTGNVSPGDRLDYKLTITNNGDMNASNVAVDDVIPANTTAVGNAAASSGMVDSQDPVKVTGMSVPAGASATVTFSVTVNGGTVPGTVISNQGSATYDPDGPNCELPGKTVKSNVVENTVVGGAVLKAVKAVSPVGSVAPGDRLDYTITITNNGDIPATGVVFDDVIPANSTAVGNAAASSGTVVSQDPVKVTGMSLPVGGSATVTFSVIVNDDAPDQTVITNQGSITYILAPAPQVTVPTNPVSNTVRTPARPKISTHWYMSEGYTGKDLYYPGESFDTYILIQNVTTEEAEVEATFMREGDTPVVKPYKVPGESRFTIHLNEVEGCANKHISTRLVSTNGVDIAAERSMYFDYYGKKGGSDSIGVSQPSATWVLPEGYTGDNNYPGETFNTYILLENPSTGNAKVDLSFFREGTTPINHTVTMTPDSRYTVKVDEIPGCENHHISTYITADVPVIAERAEYFNYYGITGGHASIGATALSTEWYLAEGYTGDDFTHAGEKFDTYILLVNPDAKPAAVKATYMREGTTPVVVDYILKPTSRFTIRLDDVEGCKNVQVATMVNSDIPIAAERAMYFNYYGIAEGSDSIGASLESSGPHWLLPEGYTGDNNYPGEKFDSYILLMNPNKESVEVDVKFMTPPFNTDTLVETKTYTLAPLSRFTIHVDEIPNFSNISFSTEVTSKGTPRLPIACERSMYFMYYGIKGGHNSIGYDP